MPVEGNALTVWTVYDHPTDFPDHFVARAWHVEPGGGEPMRTERVLLSTDLDDIRQQMQELGGYRLAREPGDDPTIVESWV